MQKIQLKLQKAVMIVTLAAATILFVYALGFATDIYALNYHTDPSNSLLYVRGAELYNQIQPFNNLLLGYALAFLVLSLFTFLTLSHKRRLYYVSNYVSGILSAGAAIFISTQLIQYVAIFKQMYLNIDFQRMREVSDLLKLRYVESTFMLDAGFVLSGLLLVVAVLLLTNLVLKTIWMRKERQALANI